MNTSDYGQPATSTLVPTYNPIPSAASETYPKEAAMSAYPQAPYSQTAYPQAAYPQAIEPQPVVTQDPGRTLGVVGLILSVVANVVGLVVSIVAYRKSRRAGFKNGAAIAGIVIGLITTLGLVTASVVGGLAAKSLVDTCRDLGPGQHVVHGVTYTCG